MVTLDGLGYEFQQVGEYVLISDGGDFVVQKRSLPWFGSSTLTGNQALAANVAGDRVGVYYGAAEPLLVNGLPAAAPQGGLALAHGGRVSRDGGSYVLEWPSGERVTLSSAGFRGSISIYVHVPDRTRAYVGLLGTWDGEPRNDLVARTGEALAYPFTADAVYGVFGDSWRVTPEESLFDYESGQDTSTFTDESFPSQIVTTQTLSTEQYNQARDACIAAGVVEEAHLDGCILDVAASGGDESVATAAAEAAPPPVLEKVTFGGYYQNFERADDGRWSTTARFQMPAMDGLASTNTLGLVQPGETITLTITALPEHANVSVAFDTHVIGPWAGDIFEATADGVAFTTTSFSNTAAAQKFPGQASDVDRAAQSEALAVGSLGLLSRAIYHHSYTFAHSATSLVVSLRAPSLPQGASFALDNVAVVTGVVGDPWDPKCVAGGASLDDGNPCTLDQCDPGLGAVHTPRASGTPCADLDLCDGQETCNAYGQCVGTPLTVGDGNPCTVDSCDARFGVIRDPLPLGTSCSDGNRCNGAEACNGAGQCAAGTPPSSATLPADTTCDRADDDCDGVVDDDYLPTPTQCGNGACAATGQIVCANGLLRDTCVPAVPASGDFVCDGIDADCNGTADEDYVRVPTGASCGVGACARQALTSCVAGAVVETCTPGYSTGSDASCNGIDEDCNGIADEDYVATESTCGTGACRATGIRSCVAGHLVNSCVAGTPAASDASCNGIDEDCNGLIDEDYVRLPTGASCGVGACARQALTSCVAGAVVETCTPGTPATSDASCNGIDEDCNGIADEEFVPVATACGLGECATTGVSSCVAGVLHDSCVAPHGLAADSSCDGLDENCNGTIDEGYVARATQCGAGTCRAAGTTSCVAGVEHDSCLPRTPAASDPTCDGIDDDCDGVYDEDYVSVTVACGVGACAATAEPHCFAGRLWGTCTPGTPAASDATCDGIDDDCSGVRDEDYVSITIQCGRGACGRWGALSCVSGTEQHNCVPGEPAPDDATCDGIDDDCDGVYDEDYPRDLETTCGIGACQRSGRQSCWFGQLREDCWPGPATTPTGADDDCDGIDDDCDGLVDEDAVHHTSLPDDHCDGVDDDCDGLVDEDFPPMPTECGVGACSNAGALLCASGALYDSCTPGVPPATTDAACDGLDTDCDGLTDEDYVSVVTSCGVGTCAAYGSTSCAAGQEQNDCIALCEAACSDLHDDDGDGLVDCDDSDCASHPACATQSTTMRVGAACSFDADCGTGERCDLSMAGGYCVLDCDLSQPAGQECSAGLTCWIGSSCVVPCGAGETCNDPRLTCGDFSSLGLPPDPFCHPTCASSCPSGTVCDPDTSLCF